MITINASKIISLLVILVMALYVNVIVITKAHDTEAQLLQVMTENYNLQRELHNAEILAGHLEETLGVNSKLTTILRTMPGATLVSTPPKYSVAQDANCLTLLLYYEEGMGSEIDLVKIANTVYNRIQAPNFKNDTCAVVKEGDGIQYSSMGLFLKEIEAIKHGDGTEYIPNKVRENILELNKWNRIKELAVALYTDGMPLYTDATHFVSVKLLRRTPNWLRHLRPVGVTTGHFLLADHAMYGDKRVIYTAERPFNQARHNKVYGVENVDTLANILKM